MSSQPSSSKHLINPELLSAFNGVPPVLKVNANCLVEAREMLLAMSKAIPMPSAAIKISKREIPGPADHPRLEVFIYEPATPSSVGLLHIHGGGYVLGSAEMDASFCAQMCDELNAVIVSVDYRLAPETKFPGALEDCYAALLWMKRESQNLGFTRIATIGESAGGGLAASLGFLSRDRREVSIALQFLTYPMLDDRTGSTTDPGPLMGEFLWTRESNAFGWSSYIGAAEAPPYPAVPARIEDLRGLPPTFMICGAMDLFAIENLLFAQRLISQGVPTEMHLVPGAPHSYIGALGTRLANEYYLERQRVFRNLSAI